MHVSFGGQIKNEHTAMMRAVLVSVLLKTRLRFAQKKQDLCRRRDVQASGSREIVLRLFNLKKCFVYGAKTPKIHQKVNIVKNKTIMINY